MKSATWLWLGLSLVLCPVAAHAREAPPTFALPQRTSAPPGLGEDVLLVLFEPARVELAPPCLGCRAGLRKATDGYAAAEVEPPPPPPERPRPQSVRPVQRPVVALGETWQLRGGRSFSVNLTPTPEECAPLIRLSF